MIIAGKYSFNNGENYINSNYPHLLTEIEAIISNINAPDFKTKVSKEKTMTGKILYNPPELNNAYKVEFEKLGWASKKEYCEYPTEFYVNDHFVPTHKGMKPFREMDFVKEKLGVEVQFGKYAFMVYNVCAKMTIFRNLGYIDCGIEIVPIKKLASEMSTGVSYFEQIVWDLEKRGVSNIDIPVLILGIDDKYTTNP